MSEKSEAKDFNSRNYIGFRHNTSGKLCFCDAKNCSIISVTFAYDKYYLLCKKNITNNNFIYQISTNMI